MRTTFCDPTGARTQDPIIKSDVLYQLSYRVDAFKKYKSFCDPTGARTQDPIIKSDVLYQLSYRVIFICLNAGANIRCYYLFFKAFYFKFVFFYELLLMCLFIGFYCYEKNSVNWVYGIW